MGALWHTQELGSEVIFDWDAEVDPGRCETILCGLNRDLDRCVLKLGRESDPRARRALQCQREFLIESLARVTNGTTPPSMRFSLVDGYRVSSRRPHHDAFCA